MQRSIPDALGPRPIDSPPLPTKAYSPGQVAGAAFVGSPIAGGILLASNFLLFGAPQRRGQALLGGALATVVLLVVSIFLPDDFPNAVLPGAYTLAFQQIANRTQGADFESFIASGGSKYSNWRVFGISLLCLFGVLIAILAVAFSLPEEWIAGGTA